MADHAQARPGPGRIPRRGRRACGDGGSAAAELVLITPLLMLLLLLIVAAGRLVDARLQVDSAAIQAARAASLARDPATAAADATATARAALASEHITCSPLAVRPDTADFRPGGQVSVQVSCTVSLAGLSLLHLPGAETLTSRFTSPIDTYRGIGSELANPGGARAGPAAIHLTSGKARPRAAEERRGTADEPA